VLYEAAMRAFIPDGAVFLIVPFESVLSATQFEQQIDQIQVDAGELLVDYIVDMQSMLF
jgi:hypothetical protein